MDGTPFAVLGDFNRRIEIHGQNDHLWAEIDDGEPAGPDLKRLSFRAKSPCLSGTPGHHLEPIDYLVFDEQAWEWVDEASFRIMDYEKADKSERHLISDHCPTYVDLVFAN